MYGLAQFLCSGEVTGILSSVWCCPTPLFFPVCNKWIHERGQEFRRPCGLSPEEWCWDCIKWCLGGVAVSAALAGTVLTLIPFMTWIISCMMLKQSLFWEVQYLKNIIAIVQLQAAEWLCRYISPTLCNKYMRNTNVTWFANRVLFDNFCRLQSLSRENFFPPLLISTSSGLATRRSLLSPYAKCAIALQYAPVLTVLIS